MELFLTFRNKDSNNISEDGGGGWEMDSKTFKQISEQEVNLYRAEHNIKVDDC